MVRSWVAGLRCTALCLHQNMITLCNQHFGQAVGSRYWCRRAPEGDCDFDTLFISVYRIVYGLHHYLFSQIHHTIRLQQNQSHVMSMCYKDCNYMMHA